MEDAHATILNLQAAPPPAQSDTKEKDSFFAVYDGHGGKSKQEKHRNHHLEKKSPQLVSSVP